MAKWNDTDTPIAYRITFRTYGTWLHGDERGSMSRHRNIYGTSKLKHEPKWIVTNSERMNREPVILDAKMRSIVKKAVIETCEFRSWNLYAIDVRTNHAHAVVSAGDRKPEPMLNALKSNATRLLRSLGVWNDHKSPWSDKGSNRYIWTEDSLARACSYVRDHQGGDLPMFD